MVSIIIPLYNAEKHLIKCIESILQQDFKDFEIILVDDGSTDGSKNIALEMAKNHGNINYLYQENRGAAAARNTGISYAKGEYIIFVDADDIVGKNMISTLLYYCQNEDCDIAMCSCTVFDVEMQYDEHFFEHSMRFSEENKYMLFEQLVDLSAYQPKPVTTACGVPWGKIYKCL